MPLFRDENPALGPTTSVKELSGFGSGTPLTNYFKPTTREIILSSPLAAASTSTYLFIAPWKCQVVSVKATYTVAGGAGAALDVTKTVQSALPLAPGTATNGTTVIDQLSATIPLTGAANTTLVGSLSTASGSPNVLNAGDQLSFILSGTLTGLVNLVIQIEVAQIG